MSKTCTSCKVTQDLEEFNLRRDRGPDARIATCRTCGKARSKKYYSENKERFAEQNKQRHALNREVNNARSRKYHAEHRDQAKARYQENREEILQKDWERGIQRKYSITPKDYFTMLESQNGCCAICSTDTPWGRSDRFAIDHDHASGEVRGLLCHACNTGLGNFKDSINSFRKAIAYLGGADLQEAQDKHKCRWCGQPREGAELFCYGQGTDHRHVWTS